MPASEQAPAEVEPAAEVPEVPDVRWQVDDLDATWWDDVWPFNDGAEDPPATDDDVEDEPVEPDEPEEDGYPREVAGVGGGPGARGSGSSAPWPVEGRSDWGRRLSATCLVAAFVAIVGYLAWVGLRPEPDVAARLADAARYRPPVPLTPDTSYVRSRILPSGQVEVTHWVSTRTMLFSVELETPHVPGLASDAVSVTDLTLASDGAPVPTNADVRPGHVTTIWLPPTQQLFLRYRLRGVVDYATAAHDRALARITALDVTTVDNLQYTTHSVSASRVLALACLSKKGPSAVPCGQEHGRTWLARLGPGHMDTQVMAQVNLTRGARRNPSTRQR
jgi:hypothetical protein